MSNGLSAEEMRCVCDVLRRFSSVQTAVLFGSRAKGTFRAGSDVDLAVKGCSESEIILLSAALNEETVLPYFFDVVAYETIQSSDLIEHIHRAGITIYEKQ